MRRWWYGDTARVRRVAGAVGRGWAGLCAVQLFCKRRAGIQVNTRGATTISVRPSDALLEGVEEKDY
jgi:hypothetical protein